MEEEHDELRYVCKLCDKRYPSGKSLGGHMRSHVIAAAVNLAESDDKFEQVKKISTMIINGNENANSNSNSYGLRENPKKSWRAVGSSSSTLPFPNEKVCKQCGKGFQSLKALCGHMAFHSDKDRGLKDYDHSWTVTSENLDNDQDKLLIEDSHSDTEENELGQDDNDDEDEDEDEEDDPICVTRSKTKRYKKLVVKPSCYSLNYANCASNNSNYNNGSSSVSEIDELEQEELAICLMMLSKDSTNWGGVNSVVESSDNNSVVETKLSSMELKNCRKEWNMAKNETESCPFENSNSEYCKNGTKKVESDISVEEQLRNGDQQKNASKEDIGFDYKNLTYAEKQEIRRNLFREFGYDEFLEKRIRDSDDSYYPDREGPYKKKNKYECMNCNKVFSSFQGLGGHRPCHKKNNAFGSGGNSSDVEFARSQKAKYEKKIKPKKNKGHECPICFRMFKSGQALGGHKRSHFLNGTADRMDYMAPIGYEEPVYNDMIDLNLPAPEED